MIEILGDETASRDFVVIFVLLKLGAKTNAFQKLEIMGMDLTFELAKSVQSPSQGKIPKSRVFWTKKCTIGDLIVLIMAELLGVTLRTD